MRTKEKIYLGHANLKRLLCSVPFNNFLIDKFQVKSHLEWYDAISDALQTLLRADTTPDKIKGAFQQSKLCSAEVAKQIIALVEIYEGTEASKKVSWKNYNVFYKEEGRVFRKYFRQYMLEQSKEPLPESELEGVWAIYSIRDGAVYRSFFEVDFKNDLHIYYLMGKHGRLTYCDLDSRKKNRGIRISGDLEGTLWHYDINGRFDKMLDGKINIIRGMITITHEEQLGICPVFMWRINDHNIQIKDLDEGLWGKMKSFDKPVPSAEKFEKSLLIYYQYLLGNAENVYDPRPVSNLTDWIKEYLKQKGRTKYSTYQKALTQRKWISLCRHPEDHDLIRIFYWTFDFHPLHQSIIVKRVLREGDYSEIVFMGEMKYHNGRFWIEFDSGDRHKVMMLQSSGKAYPGNLYFLAMGSASFINFVNDPGDMLTEIVLPLDHLPNEYHDRYALDYSEFRNLNSIPLDLRLYLNHRDRAILSFDNPNSIKSSLQKQMAATAYQGSYLVYAYHRYLDKPFRLIRFSLEMDHLAVATLRKVHADEPNSVHVYQGLAEEHHKSLHITLKHLYGTFRADRKTQKQSSHLLIDTSLGARNKSIMTGVITDIDREGNPMSLPCVMVRTDNAEEDFPQHVAQFEAMLNRTGTNDGSPFRAHCLSDSEEYQLLEELLWTRQRPFLEHRFPKTSELMSAERSNFIEAYFDTIGGVFYNDYSKQNKVINKAFGDQVGEPLL